MVDRKVKYMWHPVSPEEKDKARREGYKIVDAKFAPKGQQPKRPGEKVVPKTESKAD